MHSLLPGASFCGRTTLSPDLFPHTSLWRALLPDNPLVRCWRRDFFCIHLLDGLPQALAPARARWLASRPADYRHAASGCPEPHERAPALLPSSLPLAAAAYVRPRAGAGGAALYCAPLDTRWHRVPPAICPPLSASLLSATCATPRGAPHVRGPARVSHPARRPRRWW